MQTSMPALIHGYRVSSKATLRIDLSSLRPLVPSILWASVTSSSYCASKSNSLVIQSDDSRKQQDNVRSCFVKLNNLLLQAGRNNVPGETSPEQTERVKHL